VTTTIHRLSPNEPICYGATMGQKLLAPLLDQLRAFGREDQVVILDLAGIEVANASFLKATALWLQRAGAVFADLEEGRTRGPVVGPEPLNVFPLLANAGPEVLEEIDTILRSEQIPLLVAVLSEGDRIVKARRMGHLDLALEETLTALAKERTATASSLCERYPQKPPIKSPAWSNRLAELYRLRLARRDREGRQWRYVSLAEEVLHG
jgi:hypothetical protein